MKKQPTRDQIQQPGRRTAIKAALAGTAAVAFPFVWTPSRAASKRIVIRDDGGIYTKAYGAVFYRPFTENWQGICNLKKTFSDRVAEATQKFPISYSILRYIIQDFG